VDNRARLDAIVIDFAKAFDLVPHENCSLRRGIEGSCMEKGIPFGSYAESQSWRTIVRGSQSNVRCTTRERIGSTFVSIIRTQSQLLDSLQMSV
jgi:hypothetical protein